MRILSLNGGGMLGYMQLVLLEQIEYELGKSHEIFDLICGVSTGSIIGAGLSIGIPAYELKAKYKELRNDVFGKKKWFLSSLFKPVYELENLETCIKDVYGSHFINNTKTNFMTYAVNVSNTFLKTKFWRTWDDNIEIYKAVTASCSVPYYFNPYNIDGEWYVDGGLSDNNPSMVALTESLKDDIDITKIKLLNLWSTKGFGLKNPSKFYGLITVIRDLPYIFTNAGEDCTDFYVNRILGNNVVSIQPKVNLTIDNNKFDLMESHALSLWTEHKNKIIDLLTNS